MNQHGMYTHIQFIYMYIKGNIQCTAPSEGKVGGGLHNLPPSEQIVMRYHT